MSEPREDVPMPVDTDDDERHGRGRTVAAVVLVVALLIGGGAFVSYGLELWGGRTVPKVAGKSQAVATAALQEKGFSVKVQEVAVDDGVGKAVSTDPAAGSRIDSGSTVTLSIGKARTIPTVVGKSLDEARSALEDEGAGDVALQYQSSDGDSGVVLSVSPAKGSTFTSRDKVTLTVSQPVTVPYVVGKSEEEATKLLEDAGLTASVAYVDSDQEGGTVVSSSPAQGTRLDGTKVTLSVSRKGPSDYHHLADYLGYSSKALDAYLAGKGFTLKYSHTNSDGMAQALYLGGDKGTITFSSIPWSHTFETGNNSSDNVMAKGADYEGVRFDVPSSEWPSSVSDLSKDSIQGVMTLCGLTGMRGSCNNATIKLPSGTKETSAAFVCAYGEMGDLVWTALIANEGSNTRVSVTCAPKSLYANYDLSPFGGSYCDMAAYIDVYK